MKSYWRKSFLLFILLLCTVLVGCSKQADGIRDDALRNAGSTLGNASGGLQVGENVSNVPTDTPIETINTNDGLPRQDEQPQESAPPVQDKSAIVFVHGWNSTDSVWNDMRSYLSAKGLTRHAAIDLPGRGLVQPIPDLAQKLASTINGLASQGVTKVSLVSHSMGGLVCREYLRTRPAGGSVAIPTLITIATPHHGTQLFTQDCFELIGCTPRMQMNPDSDFIKSINAAGAPSGTKVVSIWTPDDEVVSPPTSCVVSWAKNYKITGLGSKPHSAIVRSSHVFELVYKCIVGN